MAVVRTGLVPHAGVHRDRQYHPVDKHSAPRERRQRRKHGVVGGALNPLTKPQTRGVLHGAAPPPPPRSFGNKPARGYIHVHPCAAL